jgi:hypothetical protein
VPAFRKTRPVDLGAPLPQRHRWSAANVHCAVSSLLRTARRGPRKDALTSIVTSTRPVTSFWAGKEVGAYLGGERPHARRS